MRKTKSKKPAPPTKPTKGQKLRAAFLGWCTSEDGLSCQDTSRSKPDGVYLTNRLEMAFQAGACEGGRIMAERIVTELEDL